MELSTEENVIYFPGKYDSPEITRAFNDLIRKAEEYSVNKAEELEAEIINKAYKKAIKEMENK